MVVKGTGTAELESGPGIYSETALPRRRRHDRDRRPPHHLPGAVPPHRRAARAASRILLNMPYAHFTYTVTGERVVAPTDVRAAVADVGYSRLVLSRLHAAVQRRQTAARVRAPRPAPCPWVPREPARRPQAARAASGRASPTIADDRATQQPPRGRPLRSRCASPAVLEPLQPALIAALVQERRARRPCRATWPTQVDAGVAAPRARRPPRQRALGGRRRSTARSLRPRVAPPARQLGAARPPSSGSRSRSISRRTPLRRRCARASVARPSERSIIAWAPGPRERPALAQARPARARERPASEPRPSRPTQVPRPARRRAPDELSPQLSRRPSRRPSRETVRTGAATTSPPAIVVPRRAASSLAPRTSSSARSSLKRCGQAQREVGLARLGAHRGEVRERARQRPPADLARASIQPSSRRKCTPSTIASTEVTHSAPRAHHRGVVADPAHDPTRRPRCGRQLAASSMRRATRR